MLKRQTVQKILLLAGISGLIISIVFGLQNPIYKKQILCIGVLVIVSLWWIGEVIPLAATSLLPAILFPIFGIAGSKAIASSYFNSIILLFVGAFVVSICIEDTGLHKQMGMWILKRFGNKSLSLLAGLMFASFFMSMWISNTATSLIMVPLALSLFSEKDQHNRPIIQIMLLGIAYACSIGGTATPVGTPPNLVFLKLFHEFFPHRDTPSFSYWMAHIMPLSIILLILCMLLLSLFLKDHLFRKLVKEETNLKTRLTVQQKFVAVVFLVMAVLWITRRGMSLSNIKIPGWSEILGLSDMVDDSTVAILAAIILFSIPVKGKRIADLSTIRRLPWDIVLLFGGGFALAKGMKASGLFDLLKVMFSSLKGIPFFFWILFIALFVSFLTEVTSNTAVSQIVLPIIASMTQALNLDPILLMIPATLSASFAFMLPVATPPNAVVYGTGMIESGYMARVGLLLDILCVLVMVIYISIFF